MTTLTKTLTFDEMVKLEPRLAALKERAFVTWQSRRWSRQELLRNWYRGIKPAMSSWSDSARPSRNFAIPGL